MYTKNNIFAIILLVSIFLVLNLVYKNIINIIIFFITFIVADNCLKNKYNALIISYIISIIYGIFKNFHLLENFSIKNIKVKEKKIEDDIEYKRLNNTNVKIKLHPNIKSIISDKLLKKFIDKCKHEDDSSIFTRKVKITDLKPTIHELSSGKIKKMLSNKKILKKYIVISNDNFIIDGHHRWYANKTFLDGKINNKDNDDYDHENDSQFITSIIINIPINKLLNKIKDFKEEYNEKNITDFKFDNNKISKAKHAIDSIKKNINDLDLYFKDLNKINLV